MSLAVTSAGAELARVRTGQWEHEPLSKLPFKVLRGHAGCINCCHFGFGDTRAVTCSEDHTAKIWDTETGRILKSFDDAHQDNITECSVNSTRGRLLTVSWDKAMKLWDLETGKLLMCETHAWPLTCCDASGDGRLLATATAVDRSLRLWDVDSCSLVVQRNGAVVISTATTTTNYYYYYPLTESQDSLKSLRSEDGGGGAVLLLLLYSPRRNVFFFFREPCGTYKLHAQKGARVGNRTRLLAAARRECQPLHTTTLPRLSTSRGEVIVHLALSTDHHEGALTGCRFDCGAQRVVTSSYDRSFKVWDLATRVATVSVAGSHANVLSDCRFGAGGRLVATASWDRTLRLWDVRTGAFREDGPLELRGGHGGSVSSCAFSSDGKKKNFITAPPFDAARYELEPNYRKNQEGIKPIVTFRYWQGSSHDAVSRRQCVHLVRDHILLEASLLVSGGLDRRAVVWDAATGSRGAVLKGHTDWVMDVDVSADKRWVLTASKDRTMRLWNIENMDRIPAVMGRESENESRVLQCEACRKPFPAMRRWGTAASSSSAVSRCSTCRSTTTGDALRRHEAEPHGP
ncbi:WD repeat-containing protein 88 [Lampetra planeri]